MLDYLLLVHGEQERRFRFAIGVDVLNPLHEAEELLCPDTCLRQDAAPPVSAPTGWLYHLDARNVWVSGWEPLCSAGRVGGARLRLLETQGKATRTRLSCFRALTQARRVNFRGDSLGDCPLDGGRALLELGAYEWSQFDVRWDEPTSATDGASTADDSTADDRASA
jgi:hypothetical protein